MMSYTNVTNRKKDKMTVYILDAKRSPMGSFLSGFQSISSVDVATQVVKALQGPLDETEEIVMGCVLPAALGQAPARQVALKAGLSIHTTASTLNKVCGSGLKAIMNVADRILAGKISLGIAGGMENMTKAPFVIPQLRQGHKYGHSNFIDHMALDGLEDAYEGLSMGVLAERLAKKNGYTREQQDAFAISSMKKAQKAMEEKSFVNEIVPIQLNDKAGTVISEDEGPKKINFDKVATLRPAFEKDGTITAASSSPISDGAAALLLASKEYVDANNLNPMGFIHSYESYSHEPEWFTTAPVNAIKKTLEKAGWSVEEVDLFEINEAFAVVPMAAQQELNIPDEKINIHGGALALGHPLGASGARVVVTLLHALKKYNKKKGVAALCIGGGEGVAIAVELV
jgi:acetyl-CoA C-acetyltransferase